MNKLTKIIIKTHYVFTSLQVITILIDSPALRLEVPATTVLTKVAISLAPVAVCVVGLHAPVLHPVTFLKVVQRL